jgi:aryl-alcohol dehydrogenase-like predicted oxidoreductase
LRVETIDLYQFHSGSDDAFQQPELWVMLERQRQSGNIRHLGISISGKAGPLQAQEARKAGAEVLQVVYNRLERHAEADFFPHAQRDDLGVLARVPLASGFLTGKYTATGPFPPDDIRSTFDEDKLRQWLAEVESIRKTELPPGAPMAQWALAWCLKNPAVSSVIPGCKTVAQLELNASADSRLISL